MVRQLSSDARGDALIVSADGCFVERRLFFVASCVGDARVQAMSRECYQHDAVLVTTEADLARTGELRFAAFVAARADAGGFEPCAGTVGTCDIIDLLSFNSIMYAYASPAPER